MAYTETLPISGAVTLTSADNMRILLIQLPRLSWRLAILVTLVFGLMEVAEFVFDDRLPLTEEPVAAIGLAFQELWPFAIGGFLFALVLVVICSAIRWARFPQANKVVTYSADNLGMTTTDIAGASIHVPWSMVTQSRRTRRYIVMKTKPGGLRFLPLRAFSAAAAENLWQLVRAHTSVK